MRNHSLFAFDYLSSDNFAKLSEQARLYYVMINFYADNGFVSNPKGVLDSMNYDMSVFNELKVNGDILTLPNRDEIFITAFFVHNKGLNRACWLSTPFGIYWKGKLWVKENGIASLKPKKNEQDIPQKVGDDWLNVEC